MNEDNSLCSFGSDLFGIRANRVTAVPDEGSRVDFSLAVKVPDKEVRVGQDITVQVTMTNISGHDIFYRGDLGGHLLPFAFGIRDSTGKEVSKIQRGSENQPTPGASGSYLRLPLHPGKSIKRERIVNREFDLSRPGKYTIQAVRDLGTTAVKSNVAAITVVA